MSKSTTRTNQQLLVTQSVDTEFFDATSGEYFVKTLPEKAQSIDELSYQWQDTKSPIQQLLALPQAEIVAQQFGNAGKTVKYTMSLDMLSGMNINVPIDWDADFLTGRSLAKPKLNQHIVTLTAIISALPNIQNELLFSIMRLWCLNGATSTVFKHTVQLMQGSKITVEKPQNSNIQELVAHGQELLPEPSVIEAEILEDVIAPANTYRNSIQRVRDNLAHLTKPARGESAPMAFSNNHVRNYFTPFENMPQWAIKGLDSQFQLMQDSDSVKERGLLAIDIDNAVTNVINHERAGTRNMGSRTIGQNEGNFYLDRQAGKLSGKLVEFIALTS
jgi:hypothetical protein